MLVTGISETLKKSVSVVKYWIVIKDQIDHVTFMEDISNDQKTFKGIARRSADETIGLTQWMKNTARKCFHYEVGYFTCTVLFCTVRQTEGQEFGNVHCGLVDMEQTEKFISI